MTIEQRAIAAYLIVICTFVLAFVVWLWFALDDEDINPKP